MVCVEHRMADGLVMEGPVHSEGQECVKWEPVRKKKEKARTNFVEYYIDDDDFVEYMNKRKELRKTGVSVELNDIINSLDKRIMYLEYNNGLSYEEVSNRFIDYDLFMVEN